MQIITLFITWQICIMFWFSDDKVTAMHVSALSTLAVVVFLNLINEAMKHGQQRR